MNFNLVTVFVFGAGAILVYSAVKDLQPKEVIMGALNGESPAAKRASAPAMPESTEPPTLVPAVYPSV